MTTSLENLSSRRWQLNPVQWAFVHATSRFTFYVGGLGAGKTFAGAARAIARGIEQPGALGLIGAPTYLMLRDATQRTFFELLPPAMIGTYTKSDGHLALTNGAEVLFRSLDTADRVRGVNLAWFWLDEAPLAGYYAWQVLKGRLRQKGFDTAGWATGTPHGRDGFARDFELEPRPSHTLFRAATYANQHNLPPDYVAELGYTGAFRQQEVEGLFVAFAGLVYRFDASPQGHLRAHPALAPASPLALPTSMLTTSSTSDHPASAAQRIPSSSGLAVPSGVQSHSSSCPPSASVSSVLKSPFARVIGGVDWGYTNPAVALVFGLDGDGRAWQLDEFYQRRAALEETLLPAILDLTQRYSVDAWYCGPDEPEHIAALGAALAREGLRARALRADNAVRAGIQTITALLAPRGDGTRGLYVSPRCVHTIAEYASYQYASAESEGRRDPSEQPLKQNDHAMDATRYALHTAFGQARATAAYLARLTRGS